MPWDLEVELANHPGTIADLGEAAASAGVNLKGGCGFPCQGVGIMHVLVDDAEAASAAFEGVGLPVRARREVLVTSTENRPGGLGALARKLADAGVNVDLVYVAEDSQIVLGVDDLESARNQL